MNRTVFTLSLVLAAFFSTMKAQEDHLKHVRILIDEDGKKTDTSFVLPSTDPDAIDKVISLFMNDSLMKIQIPDGDLYDKMIPPPPHGFFFSEDNQPGIHNKHKVMVMTTPAGDSLHFNYFLNDSLGNFVFSENHKFEWNSDNHLDSLLADDFLNAGKDFNIQKFITENGKDKTIRVIVSDDKNKNHHNRWGNSGNFGYSYQNSSSDDLLEIRDVPRKNELQLTDIKVLKMAGKGKIMLQFSTGEKGPLKLVFTDNDKKEVFTQALSYFDGDYQQEIQLDPNVKGCYFLKITQGKKNITKEITVK